MAILRFKQDVSDADIHLHWSKPQTTNLQFVNSQKRVNKEVQKKSKVQFHSNCFSSWNTITCVTMHAFLLSIR